MSNAQIYFFTKIFTDVLKLQTCSQSSQTLVTAMIFLT